MGHLVYGVAPAIRINDWGLRHLQAVIVTKLRRGESFAFSWEHEPDVDGVSAAPVAAVHGAVWISQASSLYFSYDEWDSRPLNGRWLTALSEEANSNRGLRLFPEPE